MYLDFFGLKEKPFSQTPDPRFLYWNDSYREALASLRYGIQERKGFLTFIGEAVRDAFDPRTRAFRPKRFKLNAPSPRSISTPPFIDGPTIGATLSAASSVLNVTDLDIALDTDDQLRFAVKALALTIHRGETFALVGESGSGKSMTAMALMRLLPEALRVVGGRIELQGTELTHLSEAAMRSVRGARAGMIFQEPGTSLNPVMRIGEQILEPIERPTALRGAQARARAVQWLGRVGIPEPEVRIDDYPFQFSGGQKQRIMIAIALAAEPELLIADEPTTALDVTVQAQVLALLADIQKDLGMAVLLITHDPALAARCLRQLRIEDGLIVSDQMVAA